MPLQRIKASLRRCSPPKTQRILPECSPIENPWRTASEKKVVFMKKMIYIIQLLRNKNAEYRLNFKYSRDDTNVFSKNIFGCIQHGYLH